MCYQASCQSSLKLLYYYAEVFLFSWCKTSTPVFRLLSVFRLSFETTRSTQLPNQETFIPGYLHWRGMAKYMYNAFPESLSSPFPPCGNLSQCQSNFKVASISPHKEKKVLQNAGYQGDMLAYLFLVWSWPPSSLTVSLKDHQGNSPGDSMISKQDLRYQRFNLLYFYHCDYWKGLVLLLMIV